MSILSGIMKLGGKSSVNFVKKGAVATSEVLAGKVTLPVNASTLLRSPQADTFIASAAKQKAKILSDNIVDGTIPYRVITKRLPSGTTIAQSFDLDGMRAGKEVIGKGFKSLNAHVRDINSDQIVSLVEDYVTGVKTYKPYKTLKATANNVQHLHNHDKVVDGFLETSNGLTALANAKNADYQALKNMGMVY